jgi:hypothetical protein
VATCPALAAASARVRAAASGAGPKTALRSSRWVPSVKARKLGSNENSTARPAPTGSSITAAVPPSSSAPAANPETKKSGLAAGG